MRTIGTGSLRNAKTEEEVVAIVREYLGDWMPEELARLPAHCRPEKIRDAEDINDLAFNLARERLASDYNKPLMREMEAFMAQASTRLAMLMLRPPFPGRDRGDLHAR